MSVLHLDIETRSTVDLRKTGVYVYAEDPATDVILACWALNDGPVHTWLARQAPPIELFDALRCAAGGEVAVVAHNAAFERTLHRHVLARRYGWPELPLEAWDCTMARGRAMGLPGSLDGALGAMGAPFTKDRQGHSLMLRMCKPRRIENDGTVVWWEDADRIERLAAYCAVDVQGERWLDKRILPLSPEERRVWLADQRLNDRGVPIDVDFCRAAIEVSNQTRDLLDKEMRAVTGGAVPKASNVARLRDWLISKNVQIQPPQPEKIPTRAEVFDQGQARWGSYDGLLRDDYAQYESEDDGEDETPELRRNDVERLLREALDGSPVKRALEIRLEAGKSSVKKIDAMLRRVQPDGRVRGMLTYWGAGPGRWSAAGSGIQLQNLPRDGVKNWDRARRLLDDGPETVDLLEGPPLDVLSRMLRGAILAPEGDDLIFADLASVEARGVAWLAGQDDLVDAFASGAKIYEEMGATIFDMHVSAVLKDSFERWVGKGVILGSGYQMGAPKFVATCAKSGRVVPLALGERAISSYRTRFPRIPALWYGMQDAAIAAVRNPDSVQVVPEAMGRVSFAMFKKWLQMTLPSGRKISYRNPSIEYDERFGRDALVYMGLDSKTKQWGKQRTYGGRLTENAVQGMCRDLIAHRLDDLEQAGYAPILLVHDETITEQPAERGSREEMIEIMTRLPAWAEGFPLAADGHRARRYRK
jgi:DNA polymerase